MEKIINILRKRNGFTTIELIVVLCIAGVVTPVAVKNYNERVSMAREIDLKNDMKVAQDSVHAYVTTNNVLIGEEVIEDSIKNALLLSHNGEVSIPQGKLIRPDDSIIPNKAKDKCDFVVDIDYNIYCIYEGKAETLPSEDVELPEVPQAPGEPETPTEEPEEPEVEICDLKNIYEYNGDDYITKENADDTLMITGYNGKEKELIIPGRINGKIVSSIGDYAFQAQGLTSVTIPCTVIYIGNSVFKANKVDTVDIPEGTEEVDDESFRNNKIVEVVFPTTIKRIGDNAFRNNSLVSVTIPNSAVTIGNNAFRNNKIESIVIPENVVTIGEGAFAENKITSVTIPSNVSLWNDSISSSFNIAYMINALMGGTYIADGQNKPWTLIN